VVAQWAFTSKIKVLPTFLTLVVVVVAVVGLQLLQILLEERLVVRLDRRKTTTGTPAGLVHQAGSVLAAAQGTGQDIQAERVVTAAQGVQAAILEMPVQIMAMPICKQGKHREVVVEMPFKAVATLRGMARAPDLEQFHEN
jgi:hypothetical protein